MCSFFSNIIPTINSMFLFSILPTIIILTCSLHLISPFSFHSSALPSPSILLGYSSSLPSIPRLLCLTPHFFPFFLPSSTLHILQHQTLHLTKARCWWSSQLQSVALPSSSSSPSSSWSLAGKFTSLPLIWKSTDSVILFFKNFSWVSIQIYCKY